MPTRRCCSTLTRRYAFDVSSPLDTPWRLSRTWSTSQLWVIDDEGHGGGKFNTAITDALSQFAGA
jgi:proline iminopeptidase